jgi:hypothetical protein
MKNGKPFSARNGENTRQIAVSARIRRIAKESVDLEINPGFGKLARVLENEPGNPGVKARMAPKSVGDYASHQCGSVFQMMGSTSGTVGTPGRAHGGLKSRIRYADPAPVWTLLTT